MSPKKLVSHSEFQCPAFTLRLSALASDCSSHSGRRLTTLVIPSRISSTLKLIINPSRLSVSFRYVSNCFRWTGARASTDLISTITFILNNQVRAEASFQVNRLPSNRNSLLANYAKAPFRQLVGHHDFINRLQQTGAERVVHFEGDIDDLLCNLVLSHEQGRPVSGDAGPVCKKPLSRKGAKAQRTARPSRTVKFNFADSRRTGCKAGARGILSRGRVLLSLRSSCGCISLAPWRETELTSRAASIPAPTPAPYRTSSRAPLPQGYLGPQSFRPSPHLQAPNR
jgi:hypothetical protein